MELQARRNKFPVAHRPRLYAGTAHPLPTRCSRQRAARLAHSESLPLRKYFRLVLATLNHGTECTAHGLPKLEQSDCFAQCTRHQTHVPKGYAERRVTDEFLDRLLLAPRMARCEQKVRRSTIDPMIRSSARLQPKRNAASMADCVKGLPSESQTRFQSGRPLRSRPLLGVPTTPFHEERRTVSAPTTQSTSLQLRVAPRCIATQGCVAIRAQGQ